MTLNSKIGLLSLLFFAPTVLSGCGPKAGVDSQVSYTPSEPVKRPSFNGDFLLAPGPQSAKAIMVGTSRERKAWARIEKSSLNSWEKLPDISFRPNPPSGGGVRLFSSGAHLVLMWDAYANERHLLCTLVSPDEGKSWVRGRDFPVPAIEQTRVGPYGPSAAGKARLFASSPYDGKGLDGGPYQGTHLNIMQTAIDTIAWESSSVELPLPDDIPDGAVLDFHDWQPELVVDGSDRLHFVRSALIRQGDSSTDGVVYYRSEDGKTFTATLFSDRRQAKLAADRNDPDRLVMGLLLPRDSEEGKRPAYDPALLSSDDGGKSWTKPLRLDEQERKWSRLDLKIDGENALLVAFAEKPGGERGLDLYAYDSGDRGRSWSRPELLPLDYDSSWFLTGDRAVFYDTRGARFLSANFEGG